MTLARVALAIPFVLVAAVAQTTAPPYGQCGGIGYTGPTACGNGYFCTTLNSYFYQCYPGTSTVATTTSNSGGASTTTTGSSSPATTTAPTTTTTTTGASSAPATGTATLQSGWYWIRAVESPYYHSYLETQPTAVPGTAYLGDAAEAGQFNIVDGQLLYDVGGTDPLYMNVEDPTDKTQRTLSTWFNTTANPYGTFGFSGDTVTWNVSDIDRPNTAAWLVCTDNQLYINTGAYDYDTPPGCSDQTIHSYGGSTANI